MHHAGGVHVIERLQQRFYQVARLLLRVVRLGNDPVEQLPALDEFGNYIEIGAFVERFVQPKRVVVIAKENEKREKRVLVEGEVIVICLFFLGQRALKERGHHRNNFFTTFYTATHLIMCGWSNCDNISISIKSEA